MVPDRLADKVDFDFLDPNLATDVQRSLDRGVVGGFRFDCPPDPLTIFRHALDRAIGQITADRQRFDLFQRFLKDGPYGESGEIPPEKRSRYLTDDATAMAIRFIYYHIINTFQGALAELLAIGPCMELLASLKKTGRIPPETWMQNGEGLMSMAGSSPRMALGADVYLLTGDENIQLVGVVEVKSYTLSRQRLFGQIRRHIQRGLQGLSFQHDSAVVVPVAREAMVKVGVVPSSWPMPRTFRFIPSKGGRQLRVDPPVPPLPDNRIETVGEDTWQITLRWSHETLANAAYDMTFWLMGELGREIYTKELPATWSNMTPAEAGRNAATMMLYSAIMRSRTPWESRRAIALYNAYGFGYALGAHFKNKQGHREMLWPEDLDEILLHGKTGEGAYLSHGR